MTTADRQSTTARNRRFNAGTIQVDVEFDLTIPRRLRVYGVSKAAVLQVFAQSQKPEFLAFPSEMNVPDDAKIVDVSWDWNRRCFCLLVSHESFDVVPDGDVIPWGGYGDHRIFRKVAADYQPV